MTVFLNIWYLGGVPDGGAPVMPVFVSSLLPLGRFRAPLCICQHESLYMPAAVPK
jgi:hypothetical protein